MLEGRPFGIVDRRIGSDSVYRCSEEGMEKTYLGPKLLLNSAARKGVCKEIRSALWGDEGTSIGGDRALIVGPAAG